MDDHYPCFVFTFFTCEKDFLDLKHALLSLENLELKETKRILVFVDRANRLSKSQISELESIVRDKTTFSYTKYEYRKGPDRILSQLYAFRKAIKEMSSTSYLVKCDSDLVFLSRKIFQKVKELKCDLVGHPVGLSFTHTQGGCYFLSGSIVKRILLSNVSRIFNSTCKLKEHRPLRKCPEDAFFYTFVSSLRGTTEFVRFHVSRKNIDSLVIREDNQYSILHFRKRPREFRFQIWKQIGGKPSVEMTG
jgi:hypothetical protein